MSEDSIINHELNLKLCLVGKLCEMLEGGQESSMLSIIFTETKKGADFLDNFLHQRGFRSTCIHGDRNQREREEAVNLFKVYQQPIHITAHFWPAVQGGVVISYHNVQLQATILQIY